MLIVFDLDGVLVDTREAHYQALNKALVEFGYLPIQRRDHLARFDGLPTSTKLELLGINDRRVEERKQVLTAEYLGAMPYNPKVRPFMQDYLRAGWRVGVASNAVRSTVDTCLRGLGVDGLVFSLSNEDVSRPKPNPEIYLRAMAHAGIGPADTVVVEDRPQGVEAARAAGVARVVQITDPDEVTHECPDPRGW